jgi:hypothetical protein
MDSLFDDSSCMPLHIHISEIIKLYRISGPELKDLIFTLEPETIEIGPDFMVPYELFKVICAICSHDDLERDKK